MEFQREQGSDVVVVRNAFAPEQQLRLLDELLGCEACYNSERDGRSEQVRAKNGSFFERVFGVTVDWMRSAETACCETIAAVPHSLCPQAADFSSNLIPGHYPTSFVDCFRYGSDGSLAGHVDCLFGWVLVVSLGCNAVFWYEEPEDRRANNIFAVRDAVRRPRHRVAMRSGDAILFDGGIAANVLHGIESIEEGSAPDFFPLDHGQFRYCLQYRQGRDS